MASVGEQLRVAREKQGLSIAQVAEQTKLRRDHVEALEEGNYDVFAAPVYARGFVRSYAGVVHLDAASVLADLESELGQSQRLQESTQFTKPAPTFVDLLMLQLSKVKWGITLLVTAAAVTIYLAILVYRTVQTRKTADPLAALGPGLYQPAETNSGDVLPLGPPAR